MSNTDSPSHCSHCKANLDGGNVFEYDGNVARAYGWSESSRIQFNRSVIVHRIRMCIAKYVAGDGRPRGDYLEAMSLWRKTLKDAK